MLRSLASLNLSFERLLMPLKLDWSEFCFERLLVIKGSEGRIEEAMPIYNFHCH